MNPHRPTFPALLAAAALSAAACNYSYRNPAGPLSAGEVGGTATALGTASPATVSVSVKGSLQDQTARPTGRFGILPLPHGPQTVLLRQGAARAAQREVTMGYGADGQLEGIWLGDVDLPRAVTLSGWLFGPLGTESLEGVVVDEVTGMAVPTTWGDYRLQALAVGRHRIFAATRDPAAGLTWVAGPALITAALSEQGTDKTLADLPLHAASADTGHLYLRVASMVPGLAPADVTLHVTDGAGAPVGVGPPDSAGDRDLTLPEGVYLVELAVPPAFAASVPAPDRRVAVILAGEAFDLGTLTLTDFAALDASFRSCHADADCAPGTCDAGVCGGAYAGAALPPAGAPLCADLPSCSTPGTACDLPGQLGGGGAGRCETNPSSGSGVCLPCSTRCSVDGLDTRAANACSY